MYEEDLFPTYQDTTIIMQSRMTRSAAAAKMVIATGNFCYFKDIPEEINQTSHKI